MAAFRTRSPRIITLFLCAAGYLVIMAAGWMVNRYDYGTVANLFWQTPFLAAALLYTYALIGFYRVPVWRAAKLRAPWSLWVVVLILVLNAVGAAYALANGFHGRWATIPAIFAATLIVGFAEEGMFRGFLITGLSRRIGIGAALIVSSVTFGLLHAVNLLAHASLTAVAIQVIFTMFVGYGLGTVYIRTGGSLVVVAVLHGLYDFLVFCASYADSRGGHTLAVVSYVNFAAWVILAIFLFARKRRGLPELTGDAAPPPPATS
jgi:uncharacterized protein